MVPAQYQGNWNHQLADAVIVASSLILLNNFAQKHVREDILILHKAQRRSISSSELKIIPMLNETFRLALRLKSCNLLALLPPILLNDVLFYPYIILFAY